MVQIKQGGVPHAIPRKTGGAGRTFPEVTGPHRGAFPVVGLKGPCCRPAAVEPVYWMIGRPIRPIRAFLRFLALK